MKNVGVRKRKGLRAPSSAWVSGVVAATLAAEKIKRYELSIYLTDNREIRRINREYLKHDYATDVISFWVPKDDPARQKSGALGDLVVSVDMARQYAKTLGISTREELARYLIHGTLHLLGYRDETKAAHKKMHARQEWILKTIV